MLVSVVIRCLVTLRQFSVRGHPIEEECQPLGKREIQIKSDGFLTKPKFNISSNTSQMNNMNACYGSLHAVFGSGDTNTPPLLDLSEFPSLTNRSSGDNVPQPSPMPGAKPYVGMVKQPTSEASEFTMSSEDFPALPGTQNRDGLSPGNATGDKGNGGNGDGSVDNRNAEKNNTKTGA